MPTASSHSRAVCHHCPWCLPVCPSSPSGPRGGDSSHPPPPCRDPSPPPPPGGTAAPQPHRVRPQCPPTSLIPLLSQMPFLLCVGRAFTHRWGEAWGSPLRQGAPPDCQAGPSGLLAWTHGPVHQAGVGPKDTSWQGRHGHRFRAPGTFPAHWSVVCGTAGGGLRGQW